MCDYVDSWWATVREDVDKYPLIISRYDHHIYNENRLLNDNAFDLVFLTVFQVSFRIKGNIVAPSGQKDILSNPFPSRLINQDDRPR